MCIVHPGEKNSRLDWVFSLFRSFLQDLWGPCTLLKRFMKSLLMNLGHNSARFSEKTRFSLNLDKNAGCDGANQFFSWKSLSHLPKRIKQIHISTYSFQNFFWYKITYLQNYNDFALKSWSQIFLLCTIDVIQRTKINFS